MSSVKSAYVRTQTQILLEIPLPYYFQLDFLSFYSIIAYHYIFGLVKMLSKKNSTEIQMLFNLIIFLNIPLPFQVNSMNQFSMKKIAFWGSPFFSPYLSLFFAQMSPAKSPRLKTKTDTSQNPLGFF